MIHERHILDAQHTAGGTTPNGSARIVAKLESANPTGSMKDRAALAIVPRAAQAARLQPGDTIVECTSGSTGLAGQRRGCAGIQVPAGLLRCVERGKAGSYASRKLSQRPRHSWADQFNNADVLTGYQGFGRRGLIRDRWEYRRLRRRRPS